MDPDDIPTSITRLTYSTTQAIGGAGLPVLSQNDTAKFLAHYWPAIEQHIRRGIADDFTRRGQTQASFSWGEAALIARNEL